MVDRTSWSGRNVGMVPSREFRVEAVRFPSGSTRKLYTMTTVGTSRFGRVSGAQSRRKRKTGCLVMGHPHKMNSIDEQAVTDGTGRSDLCWWLSAGMAGEVEHVGRVVVSGRFLLSQSPPIMGRVRCMTLGRLSTMVGDAKRLASS